jgi:DNA-binding IclR family transcriptional regulator
MRSDGIQSIERAIAILRAISRGSSGVRLTDIAQETSLSKSTAHRILSTLTREQFVQQDSSTGHFLLGMEIFSLGASAVDRFDLADIAHPAMARLAERTADTIYLNARIGYEAICVDRLEGAFPIKTLTLRIGDRRPLGIGAGNLALLSFMPDQEVTRAIEANAANIARYANFDAATLLEYVAATRRQGYALNDGKIIPGMFAVGVAIMGRDGSPIAALSVAAIASRMQDERRANIVTWLLAEARQLEGQLEKATGGMSAKNIRRLIKDGKPGR